MASATAIPNKSGVTEIYIGGAGDTRTRLVATFAEARQRIFAHDAHRDAHYFPHYAPRRILRCARQAVSAEHQLVVIAHSWGGDTALRVLRSLRPASADLLICVDPVPKSRLNPPPTPRNATHIIHVDARPTRPNQSDKVKDFGVWIGGTLHQRLATAQTRIIADLNHFAFAQMMASPDMHGLSAIDHLNQIGGHVSRPPNASSSSVS